MFIIIQGNVVDGLRFIGPFDNYDKALEYAEDVLDEWNIAHCHSPEDCDCNEQHAFKCPNCGVGYNLTEDESEDGCPECGNMLIWDTEIPLYNDEGEE